MNAYRLYHESNLERYMVIKNFKFSLNQNPSPIKNPNPQEHKVRNAASM
jgi:DNA-binding transcriptional MerR regulator